jgi:hypothetical protein
MCDAGVRTKKNACNTFALQALFPKENQFIETGTSRFSQRSTNPLSVTS